MSPFAPFSPRDSMAEKSGQPGPLTSAFQLFLLIVAVLLLAIVMDQADVDRDTVRLVGRVAAGITVLLFLWGIFSKVLKTFAIVVLALIVVVFMVSEGHVKAPRVTEWFAARGK